jgi:hypothetical protein
MKQTALHTKDQFRTEMVNEVKRRLLLEPNDIDLDDRLDTYYSWYQGGESVKEIIDGIRDKHDLYDTDQGW